MKPRTRQDHGYLYPKLDNELPLKCPISLMLTHLRVSMGPHRKPPPPEVVDIDHCQPKSVHLIHVSMSAINSTYISSRCYSLTKPLANIENLEAGASRMFFGFGATQSLVQAALPPARLPGRCAARILKSAVWEDTPGLRTLSLPRGDTAPRAESAIIVRPTRCALEETPRPAPP